MLSVQLQQGCSVGTIAAVRPRQLTAGSTGPGGCACKGARNPRRGQGRLMLTGCAFPPQPRGDPGHRVGGQSIHIIHRERTSARGTACRSGRPGGSPPTASSGPLALQLQTGTAPQGGALAAAVRPLATHERPALRDLSLCSNYRLTPMVMAPIITRLTNDHRCAPCVLTSETISASSPSVQLPLTTCRAPPHLFSRGSPQGWLQLLKPMATPGPLALQLQQRFSTGMIAAVSHGNSPPGSAPSASGAGTG